MPTVTHLYIYPVKSLGGIEVDISDVEKRGLKHDRRWMIVDENGTFMSQRTDARLALYRTAIWGDGLHLTNPSGEAQVVPYEPIGEPRRVTIWKDTCCAVQVSAEIDRWLSDSLEQTCSLVYMPDDSLRQTNLDYTEPGDIVGFADAFPILVIGDATMADLNSRLHDPLPVNRFRPNITVKGWDAFEEDSLTDLQIGGVHLRAAKRCARCAVTTIDQNTGQSGVEPLKTLATYRLSDQKVMFGAYFVPLTTGPIRVGDEAQERNLSPSIPVSRTQSL